MDSSDSSNFSSLPEEAAEKPRKQSNLANENVDDRPSELSYVPARPPIQKSSEKFAPVDWTSYFDREDDVSISGSDNVGRMSFMFTWLEQMDLSSFVYMEEVLLGLLLEMNSVADVVAFAYSVLFGTLLRTFTWLSFALSAREMKEKARIVAMDLRGHGKSSTENELDLSIETMCSDVLAVINAMYGESPPAIVLVGHSMGGSVASHVAAKKVLPSLCGLVVVDVVEGTAMASLIHMQNILSNRIPNFSTIEKAIEWSVKGGFLRNLESARVSVPSTLIYDESKRCYTHRARLEETEQYWKGWYEGLSEKFLSCPVPKLLLLAGTDRLDRTLTIGQMQGKFQMVVVRHTGHAIQEDSPDEFSNLILNFISRNRIGPRGVEIPGLRRPS